MKALRPDQSRAAQARPRPAPIVRSVLGGVLMGIANLVPGVSGGTMILVMGIYDEFISSIAEVTRLRFTKRNVAFLAILAGTAAAAILAFAGVLGRAVVLHRSAMFSLFVGLTLGGAPLLIRRLRGINAASLLSVAAGLMIMIVIAATKEDPPDREAIKAAAAAGELMIRPDYGLDVLAGALGVSAMVLPGISGAYMLLVLGRYETILASISAVKGYVLSFGEQGDPTPFLQVLIPVGIGMATGIALLSNVLKWMLHRHEKPTIGLLLGILLGAVAGIWPFEATSGVGEYLLGALLATLGFAFTAFLSRAGA